MLGRRCRLSISGRDSACGVSQPPAEHVDSIPSEDRTADDVQREPTRDLSAGRESKRGGCAEEARGVKSSRNMSTSDSPHAISLGVSPQ